MIPGRPGAQQVRPLLLVVASSKDGSDIRDLFAKRGFAVVLAPSITAVERYLEASHPDPVAAIIDFRLPEAMRTARALGREGAGPALVGIANPGQKSQELEDVLDALFVLPIDPARLFVSVVDLVSKRRGGTRRPRVTGVVGVVDGNDLFLQVAHELHTVVPPMNAGAILEQVLRQLGSGPFVLGKADLAAMLASGRLAQALLPFSDAARIDEAMRRISAWLAQQASKTNG